MFTPEPEVETDKTRKKN